MVACKVACNRCVRCFDSVKLEALYAVSIARNAYVEGGVAVLEVLYLSVCLEVLRNERPECD